MYTRHDDLPVLSAWPTRVAAMDYNAAARCLARAGRCYRLELPDMFRLALIVQSDAWIVVDAGSGDMPMAAWAGLCPPPDRGLHEPVPCELRYFHAAAGKVVSRLRGNLDGLLADAVPGGDATDGPSVIPFPGPAG